MAATQARGIYETIVRQKRDPALVELAGHGLLRARVFPINPGETRKITLRYTQILDRAGDAWRFRYVGGPSGSAASRSFRLEVDSAARFGEPYSPTHRVSVTRTAGGLAVTLADSSWSGDLELLLPLARGLVGMSLLTQQSLGEDGYFMLLLAPGQAAQAVTLHRDLVAVLDVSGSMSGEKLDQAKAALVQLLGTLRPSDRFRVITFSSDVRRYAPGWTDASGEHVRDAQQWVRASSAEGGTNIAGALGEAFAAAPAEGALGVVVFLTDGMPTVGETDPERIATAAETEPRRVPRLRVRHRVRREHVRARPPDRAGARHDRVPPAGRRHRAGGRLARDKGLEPGADRPGVAGGRFRSLRRAAPQPARPLRGRRTGGLRALPESVERGAVRDGERTARRSCGAVHDQRAGRAGVRRRVHPAAVGGAHGRGAGPGDPPPWAEPRDRERAEATGAALRHSHGVHVVSCAGAEPARRPAAARSDRARARGPGRSPVRRSGAAGSEVGSGGQRRRGGGHGRGHAGSGNGSRLAARRRPAVRAAR